MRFHRARSVRVRACPARGCVAGRRTRRACAGAADPPAVPAAGAAVEGEIIASAEMAAQMAPEGQWSADAELALYVVHGLLHLCGYDDLTPADRSLMKTREILAMNSLGFNPVYAEEPVGE